MRTSKYRAAVALLFLVIVAGGLIFNLGLGTVSSFGFDKIAAICPLGALETFLASKNFCALGFLLHSSFYSCCGYSRKSVLRLDVPCAAFALSPWCGRRKEPQKIIPKALRSPNLT